MYDTVSHQQMGMQSNSLDYLLRLSNLLTNNIKKEVANELYKVQSFWAYVSKKCNVTLCKITEYQGILFLGKNNPKVSILLFLCVGSTAPLVYLNFVCVKVLILELKYSAMAWQ